METRAAEAEIDPRRMAGGRGARRGWEGRRGATVPRRRRRGGRLAALALAVLALAGVGGWLGLRDSSLFAARRVSVVGLAGAGRDEGALRAALVDAVRDQSTLQVDAARLRHVAAAFPAVVTVRLHPEPPHRLRVDVVTRPVVAVAAEADGRRVAVAADGTLLPGVPAPPHVPVLALGGAAGARTSGGRLRGGRARAALASLAAAPGAVRGEVASVGFARGHGLTVGLRHGPALYFGSAARARAKWTAAIRVLADPAVAAAGHIDLHVPERPAVGSSAPPNPPDRPAVGPSEPPHAPAR